MALALRLERSAEDTYREGTTHIVMSPLEFIQRLAALVARPRLHLIRFHGVLAPNARLRPDIIPNVPVNANTPSADYAEVPPPAAPAPMSWGRLLKRVFEIDIEHCPQCHLDDHRRHRRSARDRQILTISACSLEHRPDHRRGTSL
jgi:putative transposase